MKMKISFAIVTISIMALLDLPSTVAEDSKNKRLRGTDSSDPLALENNTEEVTRSPKDGKSYFHFTQETLPLAATKKESLQRNATKELLGTEKGSEVMYNEEAEESSVNPSLRKLVTYKTSARYGGYGGSYFDDGKHATGVKAVQIRDGSLIDRIHLIYNDGSNSVGHGGTGGVANVFELGVGEYINKVVVRSGWLIDQLTFITNKQRHSRVYGGGGGTRHEATAPFGYMLGGINGRSGRLLDQITFYWVPAIGLPGDYSEHITSSVGGDGGTYFNDGRHEYGIESIKVRSGSLIDSIQVTYRFDGEAKKHGGSGGWEQTFTLGEGEYITDVKVQSGRVIDQLRFVTNKGRWSPQYGGNGGTHRSFTAPNGYMLGSIRGRSGSKVDQLAFVFVPINEPSVENGIVKLVQLHGQTGGSSGTFTKKITYKTGVSMEKSSTTETRTKITSEATVKANVWTAEVTATLGTEWAQEIKNSITFNSHEEKTVETSFELDLSTPVYIYQAQFQGTFLDAPIVAWSENYYISDEPVLV